MLKKEHRLKAGERILNARVLSTKLFTLKFTTNKTELSRFGFLVSKKIDKRAVVRNRLRRKTRKCIEDNLTNIKPGFDFLFILKKEALEKTEEICNIVNTIFKKENLFR